jgi:hypothetical protein
MAKKEITVVRYGYKLTNADWAPDLDVETVSGFVAGLSEGLNSLDITVNYLVDLDVELEVSGYGDLLNIIRLRSPKDHIGNLCLGHIIGQSANCASQGSPLPLR